MASARGGQVLSGWSFSRRNIRPLSGLDLGGFAVTGHGEVAWFPQKVIVKINRRTIVWLNRTGWMVSRHARQIVNQRGPTPPGSPVGRQSGELRDAIGFQVIGKGTGIPEVRIGMDLTKPGYIKGRIHELGGVITNGFGKGIIIRIPARPYLRPSLYARKKRIVAMLHNMKLVA